MKIRMATPDDAENLLAIYRPYILETAITFEIEPPTVHEFRKRVEDILVKYPWLVCEIDGDMAGYAYAGVWKERAAYAWSAESSVYIKQGLHGRGIGTALYTALIDILKKQGVVTLIGGMTLPNEGSRKLHEQFGFVKIAQFENVGFKLGRWWDVGFWQLHFDRPERPERLLAPLHPSTPRRVRK